LDMAVGVLTGDPVAGVEAVVGRNSRQQELEGLSDRELLREAKTIKPLICFAALTSYARERRRRGRCAWVSRSVVKRIGIRRSRSHLNSSALRTRCLSLRCFCVLPDIGEGEVVVAPRLRRPGRRNTQGSDEIIVLKHPLDALADDRGVKTAP
jgi:hypothetical protein